ncbi:MAG: ABC transporter permease [Acidobacteriia bacterium]|nr:ABC transporter permease [Terriglobia bacterium]
MRALLQDLRYGLRMLSKNRGFTLVAVFTLALGIGANTAIFSVVNAVLLRPLPYPEPDRIVTINWDGLDYLSRLSESSSDHLSWKDHVQSFESVASYQVGEVNLAGGDEPERVRTAQVTRDFFRVLEVRASLGRDFSSEQIGGAPVIVISDGLWRRQYGVDPNLIGKSVMLNAKVVTVLGIMPPRFEFPEGVEAWVLPGTGSDTIIPRVILPRPIARLKRGLSLAQAQAQMDAITARGQADDTRLKTKPGILLTPLQVSLASGSRTALFVLLGVVGFVLLIACANLANLLLARGAQRTREYAIRTALGASRLQLIMQLLTESVLLSLAGGTLGVIIAEWGVDLMVSFLPIDLPKINPIEIDRWVLGATTLLAVTVGFLFGLAPSIIASKPDLIQSLKEGSQAPTNRPHRRLRGALLVSEVGLAFVLLIGAGLMIRTLRRLLSVDPGFQPKQVLTMDISLPTSKYSHPSQISSYYEQVLTRIEALPAVLSVGAVSYLPLAGRDDALFPVRPEGRSEPVETYAPYRTVTPAYFSTLGIPLLRGRFFDAQDAQSETKLAIVNNALARRLWPGEDPIGTHIKLMDEYEVIGEVGGVRDYDLQDSGGPLLYVSMQQSPSPAMSLVIQTSGDPTPMISAIRGQVLAVDKDQPVSRIMTMDRVILNSVSSQWSHMLLLTFFAGLALVLADVGVYGLVGYQVTQRTHELGVRQALGALPGDVLWLVVREGMMLAAIGLLFGLTVALGLSRVIASFLFGVTPSDPLTFIFVSLLLIAAALVACYIPARRATKVDPVVALRYE